ncbi:protein tdcF, partial [Vibrio harveyi]
FTASFSMSTK